MSLNIKQLIEDKSDDRQYFAMIPTMLWPDIKLASSNSPGIDIVQEHAQELGVELDLYDKWLYATLKRVCGEAGGQCFLNTPGLARLAGISEGKVSSGKKKLQRAGLITIISKKRSAKGQAIDHITIIDIWERNVATIKARQSLHGNAAKPSWGEGKSSPHETEEEPIEEEPIEEYYSADADFFESPFSYQPGPDKLISCEDPDTGEVVGEENWREPDTQLQAQAFCVCGRSRFHSKAERNKLERIEAMLEAGRLPEEFWKNRLWCAGQYRWSLPMLLKFTLSEDSLRGWEAKQ